MKIIEERRREPYFHTLFRDADHAPDRPLICITPLLGRLIGFEDLFWEKYFARFFVKNGFTAVIMDRVIFGYDPNQPMAQIPQYIEASIIKNQRNLDALSATSSPITPTAIGTFGVSFGSIIHSLWAARDPRLKANLFALTGADIPAICVRSRDPLMRSMMRDAFSATQLSPEVFEQRLRECMPLDPLYVGPKLKGRANLLIQARWDRVIPRFYGEKFREALGFPETIYLPLGHYFSVLAIPFVQRKILDFFGNHLLGNGG